MREWLEKGGKNLSHDIVEVFESYDNFTKELIVIFGEVDEVRTAERKL